MENQAEAILATLKTELASFTTQFRGQFDKTLLELKNGEIKQVSDEIKTVGDAVAKLEAQAKTFQEIVDRQKRGLVPGMKEEVEKKGISILEAVPGLPTYKRDSRSAEMVREWNSALPASEQRDLSSSDSTAGGVLVGTELLPGFLPLAMEGRKIWDPGFITQIDGLVGNVVEMPKLTSGTAVYWLTENLAPTKSAVTFGQIRMTPKKAGVQVRISNRLIRQAGNQPEMIVRDNIAKKLGIEIDRVALHGLGNQNEPLGLCNRAGIQSVAIGTNGGDWTFEVAQDMVELLELAFKDDGVITFAGHPRVINRGKKQRIPQFTGDTGGMYPGGVPLMSDAALTAMLGYPFRKSQQFYSTISKGTGTNLGEIIAGKWKDCWVGFWDAVTFKASTETGDNTGSAVAMDQTWLFCFVECDMGCAYEESFVLCNDAKTRA